MSQADMETEETEWTKEDLQKLLAAMKTSISENDKMRIFYHGLKSLDWEKVAFPPFSPEACQEKWKDMLQKMRKVRTLTELIVEAEDVISNPTLNRKIHPEKPKLPSPANAIFYERNVAKFQRKHPNMDKKTVLKSMMEKYAALSGEKKAKYEEKYQLAKAEYNRKMKKFRELYEDPPSRKRKKKVVSKNASNGEQHSDDTEGLPPNPPRSGYHLFCKEQTGNMEGVSKQGFVCAWAQQWQKLSSKQKSKYTTRCKELQREYSIKLNSYLSAFDLDEQQRIVEENAIKRPYVPETIKREKFPGEPRTPSLVRNAEQMKKFPKPKDCFEKTQQTRKEGTIREKKCYTMKGNAKLRKYTEKLQKWYETLTAQEQERYRLCNPSKCQYLDANQSKRFGKEEYKPSDSEDEELEDSSSDEEEADKEEEEEEEDEEENDDNISFTLY